jgi:hypothetical protein
VLGSICCGICLSWLSFSASERTTLLMAIIKSINMDYNYSSSIYNTGGISSFDNLVNDLLKLIDLFEFGPKERLPLPLNSLFLFDEGYESLVLI